MMACGDMAKGPPGKPDSMLPLPPMLLLLPDDSGGVAFDSKCGGM